jgi:hypothetical protein
VNVRESEREQSGIIRGQFCGARPVGPIFRGALNQNKFARMTWPRIDDQSSTPEYG